MAKINENYLKLPGSYLFSDIAKKVSAYEKANPDKTVIRLGIGDVTQPLAPAVIEALHNAVDEMGMRRLFTAMPRIWVMNFCAAPLQNMIMRNAAVLSRQMRFLSQTGPKAIPQIFRRFSARTIR